ncbi:hypothetical protein J8281_13360 [Aquimarina sp. U1-2]|uniref:hypothetical protein n=1 Tax=Aquimarina sp. U1-2 TaxID=2823141 RepID=UPI001AECF1B7|nr:hypothetical protein [Aquimarina sp. U1-2]MBP2833176.1 hypothetical protein [Aquimarina sp. U1-2]
MQNKNLTLQKFIISKLNDYSIINGGAVACDPLKTNSTVKPLEETTFTEDEELI